MGEGEGPELTGLALTKCWLLTDPKENRFFIVEMCDEDNLNLKRLADMVGTGRLRFVRFGDFESLTGAKPGSVSVFYIVLPASNKNIELVLDERLRIGKEIGFHPGINTVRLLACPKDVFRFCREYFKFVSALSI